MAISNKILLADNDTIGASELNQLQDIFENWIQNHYHINQPLDILTSSTYTELDALIVSDDILLYFGAGSSPEGATYIDTDPLPTSIEITAPRDVAALEELYVQLQSWQVSNYDDWLDGADPIFTYTNIDAITENEDDNTIVIDYGADGDQQAGSIIIDRRYLYSAATESGTLSLTLWNNELGYDGIPAQTINVLNIQSASTYYKKVLEHLQDRNRHRVIQGANSDNVFPNLQYYTLVGGSCTLNVVGSTHPVLNETRYMYLVGDIINSLSVIKDDTMLIEATQKKLNSKPMDGMFVGNSLDLSWLPTNYSSGDAIPDASFMKDTFTKDTRMSSYDFKITQSNRKHYHLTVGIDPINSFTIDAEIMSREIPPGSTNTEDYIVGQKVSYANASLTPKYKLRSLPVDFILMPNLKEDAYLYQFPSHAVGDFEYKPSEQNPSYAYSSNNFFSNDIKLRLPNDMLRNIGSPYEFGGSFGIEGRYHAKNKQTNRLELAYLLTDVDNTVVTADINEYKQELSRRI